MSWDRREFDEVSKCACGQGHIVKHCWQEDDDWNRSRDGVSGYDIECPNCKTKYHVQSITKHSDCPPWVGSGFYTEEYLVPNGMDLPQPIHATYIQTGGIDGEIASKFTVDELNAVITDMKQNKYSTRVNLDDSRTIVYIFDKRKHIRSCLKIIPVLQEIIQKYDTYKWHPDSVAEYHRQEDIKIKENEKNIADVTAQSFELYFTRR